jgi:hypothetical protein
MEQSTDVRDATQAATKHILVSDLLLRAKIKQRKHVRMNMRPVARGCTVTGLTALALGVSAVLIAAPTDCAVAEGSTQIIVAQHQAAPAVGSRGETPEQKMRRRFPQPARVGDLLGLRVLDDNEVTIGIVRHVVRTSTGSIQLIVAPAGALGWGGRLVAVPLEAVAILGRQPASLDMKPEEYTAASTWMPAAEQVLPPDEIIRIALTRR